MQLFLLHTYKQKNAPKQMTPSYYFVIFQCGNIYNFSPQEFAIIKKKIRGFSVVFFFCILLIGWKARQQA